LIFKKVYNFISAILRAIFRISVYIGIMMLHSAYRANLLYPLANRALDNL